MRELTLTNAQFEHTLAVLGEIDLTPLLAILGGKGRLVDLVTGLPALKEAREKRIFRRLEAVWTADDNALETAETAQDLMAKLEAQAARKPVLETLEGLKAFFSGLGLSLDATRDFSVDDTLKMLETIKELAKMPSADQSASPSGD